MTYSDQLENCKCGEKPIFRLRGQTFFIECEPCKKIIGQALFTDKDEIKTLIDNWNQRLRLA